MPKALKQQLNAISLNEKTSDTMIYRDLIKGVITDPIVLGNANAEYLMNNHLVVFACKGKQLKFDYLKKYVWLI